MTREEILLIAKPILFNTDMVMAILDGRKTVTRRLVKPRYRDDEYGFQVITHVKSGARYIEKIDENENSFDTERRVNPPYQIGDYLYVRETWNTNPLSIYEYGDETKKYVYKSDYDGHGGDFGWKPSIHMPKEAARIFLRVTDVRVERLQDINGQDVLKEGINSLVHPKAFYFDCNQREMFSKIWDSTIPKKNRDKYGWSANPWVWVIEFERVEVQ